MTAMRSWVSAPSGAMMMTILLGSWAMTPSTVLYWPAASTTLRPSGKRGVTSRARKRTHSRSPTTSLPSTLRPNINSIACMDRAGAWHAVAPSAPAEAGASAANAVRAQATWRERGHTVSLPAASLMPSGPPDARRCRREHNRTATCNCSGPCSSQGLGDLFGHLLGVAEKHHGVVAVEQRIVDAGIARGERALVEHHGAGLPHLEHGHAVDRRFRIVLGGRVGHVIGADDVGDIRLGELRIDVLQFEHLVVRHVGFRQQHVHMAGH